MPVLLFSHLLAGRVDREDLAGLHALARAPVGERAPWLGVIGPALAHDDEEIRRAALAALAGACGAPAFRALVAALDDPERAVREAAVEALRASSQQMPGRWALALFHRDPIVRRAAVQGSAPAGCESLPVQLLFDRACADVVALPEGVAAVGPLLRAARVGAIEPERVRAWIASHLSTPLFDALVQYRWRTPGEVDPIVDGDDPGIAHDDSLEDFFELCADDRDAARRAGALRAARGHLVARAAYHRRGAAAILALLRRRGPVPDEVVAVLGAIMPAVLADARLPRATRLAAAEGPLEQGTGTPRLDEAKVEAVLAGDLLRDAEGGLEVRALAALLAVAGDRCERVLATVDDVELCAALDRDPVRAAPLVGHLTVAGRLEPLLASRPDRRGLIVALAFAATPVDDLQSLEGLDAASALDATLALDALRERADVRLTPAKIERATALLARRVGDDADAMRAFLLRLVDQGEPGARPIALEVLGAILRDREADAIVALFREAGDERLPAALALLSFLSRLPFAKERALAEELRDHPSREVRAWAEARIPRPALASPTWTGVVPLSDAERAAIAAATSLDALVDALGPALAHPRSGVASALAGRAAYRSPLACAALLASHDEPHAVARELARWSDATPAFRTELDAEMVRRWRGRHPHLPLLGNAWLHLFEAHAFALVERLASGSDEEGHAGVPGGLLEAASLPSALLAQQVWSAVALALEAWSRRHRERAAALGTTATLDLALAQLDTDLGEAAARILVALARALPATIAEHVPAIVARLPDLPERTRERLAPIASARGLGSIRRAPRTRISSDVEEAIARVRSLADLDALARECEGEVDAVVQEAAIALLTRGQGAGERRIAALLAREPAPPCASSLVVAVDLFETDAARDEIEALLRAGEARGAAARPDLRHRLALSLARAGRPALVDVAIDAACDATGEVGWLDTVDVERLEALRDPLEVARALVRCPHPRGYERAVQRLLARSAPTAADLDALCAFLQTGRDRLETLRHRAAEVLLEHGERVGAPLLLATALRSTGPTSATLARRISEGLLGAIVEGALVTGHPVSQTRLLDLLDRVRTVQPSACERGLRRVLEDTSAPLARARARAQLAPSRSRDRKLREIADVFAWGTVRGRELTGRMLRFHITDGGALGYAQMRSGDVNVTPMPILRGERNGRTIVEGLVLHEIGHHAFHATAEALAVWDRAQKRGLARLLNLVLDEHLERNLRSREPEWGDRLKTLAAWAFRHASTEIAIEQLVYLLGERAFDVLSRVRLGIAIAPAAVRIESGALLAELDERGHSFARFVRALRLGLGDRTGDPRVAKALALFDRRFRSLDPEGLWQITLELQRMFAQEVDLVLGVGGAESITSPGDLDVHGEGISDADVQREVKRVLEPPSSGSTSGARSGGGADVINVGPDERWAPITQVEVLAPDPAAHAAVGATVRRHAERMRRYLETLGLRWEPQRMRLRGARLDATRLRALVTRRDPRVLIAREQRERTDLFLAILIDCSGSMQGTSMERAHAFGVLLAEAARDVRGLDFRAFGFTDRVIYDAGDARRPAITSLRAGGGNNDAAALAHVVGVARRSSRRAKLVVMISDGLPTECSVSALRACVREAGKKGVACAQVAVRPLEEVCFPDYVVIQGAELDSAVARFGEVIARLVRRVMA